MSIPKLDLGELGVQIEASLRDEVLVDVDDAAETPAPQESAAVEDGDDASVEVSPAEPEAEPAAEAGADDFEAKFEERFKEEYLQRSRQDMAKLRSVLDKQVAAERRQKEDALFDAEEGNAFIERLLQALAEYDPDEAARAREVRSSVRERELTKVELARAKRQAAEQERIAYYERHFKGLDPETPELRQLFERGDPAAEVRAAMALLQREQAVAKAPKAPKAVPTPPATPAVGRNERGQFVAREAAQTRRTEAARGTIPVAGGSAAIAEVSLDRDTRTRQVHAALAQMGLG